MFSLKFIFGAAAGYIAGTAAGRERFDQLKQQFQKLTGTETVQQLQSDLSTAAERATNVVSEKVQQGGAKVSGRDEGGSDSGSTDDFGAPLSESGTYGSTADLDQPLIPDATLGSDEPYVTGTPAIDDPLVTDEALITEETTDQDSRNL